jgi:hypothetical protein
VGEAVFDVHPLPKCCAPSGRGDEFAKSLLHRLIPSDAYGPPRIVFRVRAARPQWTGRALLRLKLDHLTKDEFFGLTGRTRDGPSAHVDLEVGLREVLAIRRVPGAAEDRGALIRSALHELGIDVRPIDEHLSEFTALWLARKILLQTSCALSLRTVGRRDRARQDQLVIQVIGDVLLVAVESLGLAFTPVPHVSVLDRYAALGGDPLADARFAAA